MSNLKGTSNFSAGYQWKNSVDEITFRTNNERIRLMSWMIDRGGIRAGVV
jgi:hypothetical protein